MWPKREVLLVLTNKLSIEPDFTLHCIKTSRRALTETVLLRCTCVIMMQMHWTMASCTQRTYWAKPHSAGVHNQSITHAFGRPDTTLESYFEKQVVENHEKEQGKELHKIDKVLLRKELLPDFHFVSYFWHIFFIANSLLIPCAKEKDELNVPIVLRESVLSRLLWESLQLP